MIRKSLPKDLENDRLIFVNFPNLSGWRFDTAAMAFGESERDITFNGGVSKM